MRRVLEYLRQHAIATLALVCSLLALAGSSYAAFSLPRGSVGAPQIQNHVIDPVKFDPRAINGSVRAWAYYAPDAGVALGPGRPYVSGAGGAYEVRWHKITLPRHSECAVIGSAVGGGGYASPAILAGRVLVRTYDLQGQLTPRVFDLAVIC